MIFKTIIGLLIMLLVFSGHQQISKGGLPTYGGLRIDNGINRGVGYTDSQGNLYNLRYIPITITNDSIMSIKLQITFLHEYNYPNGYGDEQFKVFLFPKEMSPDDVTFDSITYELGNNKLREFLDNGLDTVHIFNETIEPAEKYFLAIGTRYTRAPKVCGVLPTELLLLRNRDLYHECVTLLNQDKSANLQSIGTQLALGLKLGFCMDSTSPGCTLIPCGQISYPKD